MYPHPQIITCFSVLVVHGISNETPYVKTHYVQGRGCMDNIKVDKKDVWKQNIYKSCVNP